MRVREGVVLAPSWRSPINVGSHWHAAEIVQRCRNPASGGCQWHAKESVPRKTTRLALRKCVTALPEGAPSSADSKPKRRVVV